MAGLTPIVLGVELSVVSAVVGGTVGGLINSRLEPQFNGLGVPQNPSSGKAMSEKKGFLLWILAKAGVPIIGALVGGILGPQIRRMAIAEYQNLAIENKLFIVLIGVLAIWMVYKSKMV